jgi:hypothetical protein
MFKLFQLPVIIGGNKDNYQLTEKISIQKDVQLLSDVNFALENEIH